MLWVDISIVWTQTVGKKKHVWSIEGILTCAQIKRCTEECWMGKTLYLAFVEQTFLVEKVRKFRLLSLFDGWCYTPHMRPIPELLESKPLETHTTGYSQKPSSNIQTQSYSSRLNLLITLAHRTPIFSRRANPISTVFSEPTPGVWYSKSSGVCATQPGLVVQKCTTQAMGLERPGCKKDTKPWTNEGQTNAGNKGVWKRMIYPQKEWWLI